MSLALSQTSTSTSLSLSSSSSSSTSSFAASSPATPLPHSSGAVPSLPHSPPAVLASRCCVIRLLGQIYNVLALVCRKIADLVLVCLRCIFRIKDSPKVVKYKELSQQYGKLKIEFDKQIQGDKGKCNIIHLATQFVALGRFGTEIENIRPYLTSGRIKLKNIGLNQNRSEFVEDVEMSKQLILWETTVGKSLAFIIEMVRQDEIYSDELNEYINQYLSQININHNWLIKSQPFNDECIAILQELLNDFHTYRCVCELLKLTKPPEQKKISLLRNSLKIMFVLSQQATLMTGFENKITNPDHSWLNVVIPALLYAPSFLASFYGNGRLQQKMMLEANAIETADLTKKSDCTEQKHSLEVRAKESSSSTTELGLHLKISMKEFNEVARSMLELVDIMFSSPKDIQNKYENLLKEISHYKYFSNESPLIQHPVNSVKKLSLFFSAFTEDFEESVIQSRRVWNIHDTSLLSSGVMPLRVPIINRNGEGFDAVNFEQVVQETIISKKISFSENHSAFVTMTDRFSLSRTKRLQKYMKPVVIPKSINLTPGSPESCRHLVSFICHLGAPYSERFVAYVRHLDNTWRSYEGSIVKPVTDEEVDSSLNTSLFQIWDIDLSKATVDIHESEVE